MARISSNPALIYSKEAVVPNRKQLQEAPGVAEKNFLNLNNLLHDLKKNQENLFIAFVGPTDFLVSENTIDVLSEPKIIKLLHQFQRISLQTTFLDGKHISKITHVLKEHYQDIEIEINIIFDIKQFKNERYLEQVRSNKEAFIDALNRKDVQHYGVINIYNYSEVNKSYTDYLAIQNKVEGLVQTGLDYVLSLGRLPNLTKEQFTVYANAVKELHNKVNLEDFKPHRAIERQYSYHSGHLYFSPLFYERVALFDSKYRLNLKEFSAHELELYEYKINQEQLQSLDTKAECQSCELQGLCIQRGVLELMNHVNVNECYMPKKNIPFIYYMGTLPID
jgi:hypothetical protein